MQAPDRMLIISKNALCVVETDRCRLEKKELSLESKLKKISVP